MALYNCTEEANRITTHQLAQSNLKMFNPLTDHERTAVRSSIRNSIELYRRYIALRPETPEMARKQGQKKRQLALLTSALPKLTGD